jgi:DNA uptake protein ComE-like DNA-binding protein
MEYVMSKPTIDADLQAVRDTETVLDSVLVWMNAANARQQAAVAEALKLGATAEELKPLTDELALQTSKAQAVAQAILNNSVPATPAAPPAPTV